LVEEAVRRSPVLHAYDAKDKMYRSAEAGAKSERMPTLAAFASRTLYSNLHSISTPSTIAGFVLNVPVFDGGTSGAKAAGQRALRSRNEHEQRQVENNIRLEVMQYSLDLKNSKSALESSGKSIELAMESLRLAERRFAEGVGTGIEISDATLALLVAGTNEAQARHQFNLAAYGLAKTSGKLWQIVNVE
jgi:outer membrane protein TolC